MPSSTSSSDAGRAIPAVAPGWTLGAAASAFLLLLVAWEVYCRRVEWLQPGLTSSDGLWHVTRDRVDREAGGVAIVGSSRVLFDIEPQTFRELTGVLPIQLALEGTNPRPVLKHLAEDTEFRGLVLCGVVEFLFFPPEPGERSVVLQRYRDLTPSDRVSIWLSMHCVEATLACYKPDWSLFKILKRQPWWPLRSDMVPPLPDVRELATATASRQTPMWRRVEEDPDYRKVAQDTWLVYLHAPRPEVPPEIMAKHFDSVMQDVRDDVASIRARGGDVVFLRMPSTGPFLEIERMAFPREAFWDRLLRETDAAGVHFEDHADLQGFDLPEWSHIAAGQTAAFTRALVPHLREALAARGTPRPEVGR